MNNAAARLILVYNADGGFLNMVKDGLHKLLRPATYPCSLCALTYGPVMMRGRWRRFLRATQMPVTFHHRDDFAVAFPESDVPLPVIMWQAAGAQPALLVSAAELDAIPDLAALIACVETRLAARS
jgi:hypothetical protein